MTRGRVKKPYLIALYGPPGVGKTQWAAGAPKPLFLDLENGSDNYDVARLKPKSFPMVLDVISALGKNAGDFQTVVVDTMDVLERMIWDDVCARNKWENIEQPGYGKGYMIALKEWDRFFDTVHSAQESAKLNFIFIGHSLIRTFQDPVKTWHTTGFPFA